MGKTMSALFGGKSLLGENEQMGELPDDQSLLKKALKVAWPSTLESFFFSLVGMVDTIMVSGLGAAAIASIGLTNQPKFIAIAVFTAMTVAVSAIVARRKGESDRENANKVLVQSLVIATGLTVVISVLCVVFAPQIMRLAGANEDTLSMSSGYFRIIMGGMIFNVVSMVINAAQRGVGNTKIALRTNLVSNLVNVFFNYLLIEGHFWFPRWGVYGAAVATVIGSAIACGMSIYSVRLQDSFLQLRFRNGIHFDKKTLSSMVNIGSSTLIEQVCLRVGFMLYALIVARLGTQAFATHQIVMNITGISFSFGDGLSVAAVALVGEQLGAGRVDLAKIYGKLCQRLGAVCSVFLSILFLFLGRQMMRMFTDVGDIMDMGQKILWLMAVIVFMQVAQVIYSGCLRGAGDTKFTAVMSFFSVTLVRPGAAFLFCYPLGLGLFGVWLGFATDQGLRLLLTALRFKSGKWCNICI